MGESNVLKRYLDAGMALSAITQAKAEEIVRELVGAGEVQSEQVQESVTDLLERGRQNTEQLLEQVSKHIAASAESLGLATLADLSRIEKLIGSMRSGGSRPAGSDSDITVADMVQTVTNPPLAPARTSTATAKKSGAKKKSAAAKKSAGAKKTATARKSAAKKSATARKTPAKKSATARKTPAKKTGAAKKTAAKKR